METFSSALSAKDVSSLSMATVQVTRASWPSTPCFVAIARMAWPKQADQPSANSCSGLWPSPLPPNSFCRPIASASPLLSRMARPLRPPLVVAVVVYAIGLQGLRTGDDLDQLLGDHGLTRAVVFDGLLADHVAGVARGVVHRRHLRAVEGGVVLQERAEDLRRHIAWQQIA